MHYADPTRPSYFGVDVSSWQGNVDWKKLKEEGVYFAFIRAGYRGYESGALNTDQNFEKNVRGALDAGIKVGVYFFSQALNAQEAYEEASYVLNLIDGYDITFPVVFDWETVSSDTARTNEIETEDLCQAANVFCSTVEEAGYIPMVYCNQSVSLLYYELSRIDAYDFWYAEYNDKPTFYYDFDTWQYGCTGKFAGVPDADLDVNISFVDYSALKN
jgi:GH25 family lysozyme M1 (1,4-beta-N-acetylmuramidase)